MGIPPDSASSTSSLLKVKKATWISHIPQKLSKIDLQSKPKANASGLKTTNTKSFKLPRKTPTTFHQFLDLPNEIQLQIIHYALAEPRIVIIERRYPRKRRHNPVTEGLFAIPPPLLQVCHKFRQEGEKTHPLSFAVSELNEKSLAWVRFNFNKDHLIFPQFYLQLSPNIEFHDLDRVKNLTIGWDTPFTRTARRRLLRLQSLQTMSLMHQLDADLPYGATYVSFDRPFSKSEEAAVSYLEDALLHDTRRFGNAHVPGIVPVHLACYIELSKSEKEGYQLGRRRRVGARVRWQRLKCRADYSKMLKEIRRSAE